jgi:hypothetical protein
LQVCAAGTTRPAPGSLPGQHLCVSLLPSASRASLLKRSSCRYKKKGKKSTLVYTCNMKCMFPHTMYSMLYMCCMLYICLVLLHTAENRTQRAVEGVCVVILLYLLLCTASYICVLMLRDTAEHRTQRALESLEIIFCIKTYIYILLCTASYMCVLILRDTAEHRKQRALESLGSLFQRQKTSPGHTQHTQRRQYS